MRAAERDGGIKGGTWNADTQGDDLQLPRMTLQKLACRLALKKLENGLIMQVVGDSKVIVDCCLGRGSAKESKLLSHIGVAQEYIKYSFRNSA